ncbi:alpha/beta hydrolase [Serratia sp. IR-2025]|uniref:alpha/beta hydrolase n=1 Tax=Serratia nevei TaxID=2703794 RepID=UPI0027D2C2D7|nr:alpha/beta hydrolase [Serratia nevei]MDR8480657.1 alpha/beta hydrolase [Serratia nevei]WMC73845.1 alpha/beta hydrolase [Serratia nevei]WMC79241.1 alpha/beta hydrolase [Serratia nevei]
MKQLAGRYDNGATVDNEDAILASFQTRSAAIYHQTKHEKNIAYGESERETMDWLYSAKQHQGTLIFIHGGYWQFCDKADFAFIAAEPLALGFDVVLVEYALAPTVDLDEICRQIGMALDAIQRRLPPHYAHPVYLCGHSAGGQLAALWQQHALVDAVFPISGLFELAPLQQSYVNRALQLTTRQIETLSPARRLPTCGKPLTLYYGALELPELRGQSQHYHAALRQRGLPAELVAVPGANHFTILDALFAADGALLRQLDHHGNH